MESVSDLQTQWDNKLNAYGSQKAAHEAEILSARDNLESAKNAAPADTGFFAKVKGAISGGITTLSLKNDIRKNEKAIGQLEKNIAQDCKGIFDRLTALAVETGGDSALKHEMQEGAAFTAHYAKIVPLLDQAINKIRSAAGAQEDAFATGDKALSLDAQDKSEEAAETLAKLAAELSKTGGADSGFTATAAELQELVKNTACFNLAGGGRILNDESAEFMHESVKDLGRLKTALAAMEARISARRAALSQAALQQARKADPAVEALCDSLKTWLPPECLQEAA
jgi:hypothetical protein